MLCNFQQMNINDDAEMSQTKPITTEDILKKLLFDDSSRPEVNAAVKIILENVGRFRCNHYQEFLKLIDEVPGYSPYESRLFEANCLTRMDDLKHLIRCPSSFHDIFSEIANISNSIVIFAMTDGPKTKSDMIQKILGLQAQSTLYIHAVRFINKRFRPLFETTTWEQILQNDEEFNACYDLRWGKKNARCNDQWEWDDSQSFAQFSH